MRRARPAARLRCSPPRLVHGIFEVPGQQHDPSILGAEFVGESVRIVRFATVADTLVVGVPVGQCEIPKPSAASPAAIPAAMPRRRPTPVSKALGMAILSLLVGTRLTRVTTARDVGIEVLIEPRSARLGKDNAV
jgi:hypothetical protein